MSTSLLLGWGAYARDKNTSARLCAKNAGGAYACARGGVFAGHYGICILYTNYSSYSIYNKIATYYIFQNLKTNTTTKLKA